MHLTATTIHSEFPDPPLVRSSNLSTHAALVSLPVVQEIMDLRWHADAACTVADDCQVQIPFSGKRQCLHRMPRFTMSCRVRHHHIRSSSWRTRHQCKSHDRWRSAKVQRFGCSTWTILLRCERHPIQRSRNDYRESHGDHDRPELGQHI